MRKVGGSRVGQFRGRIMPLEAEQADRLGKDAFVQGGEESFARQKNWERFPRPVSRSPTALEWCSID